MRTFHALVFDDAVEGTTPVYSEPEFNQLLALTDVIEIVAVATRVSGSLPTLTVQVERSPDDMNWVNKSATAEINGVSLTTVMHAGKSSSTDVTSGFNRLKITLGGTTPKVRLKLYATGRGEQVGPTELISRRTGEEAHGQERAR